VCVFFCICVCVEMRLVDDKIDVYCLVGTDEKGVQTRKGTEP